MSEPPTGRSSRHRRRRADRPRATAPLVPQATRLAAPAAPVSAPLDAAEVAEMKEHLGFLRRWREALRIKFNAAEDLLVNGQREPTDRGVCRHLLAKLDRGVIDAAIAREPLRSDAAARARMLAGALRVTSDEGVLLSYLEALAYVRAREEAAAAFAEVVARLDFEALSATRLARLLQVLLETFAGAERVRVLFGLLGLPGFRRAFDAAAATFTGAVRDAFAPLHALAARLEGGAPTPLVVAGLDAVLAAPDPVVRGYDEALRTAMLEIALEPGVPTGLADRAAGVLLPSLARAGKAYARLALRRAAALMARHADDRARAVLEELRRAQPGSRTAERWVTALDARRLGRVALDAGVARVGRLMAGLWLDGQRPVWVRTAPAGEAARLEAEAALQAELCVPGVAVVVEHGVGGGIPFVAVAARGRPGVPAPEEPLGVRARLVLAAGTARVLGALAFAGAALPDAEPARFLYDAGEGPVLADCDGVERLAPADARARHARLAAAVTARVAPPEVLAAHLPEAAAEPVVAALRGDAPLEQLVAVLDRAALVAPPEGSSRLGG